MKLLLNGPWPESVDREYKDSLVSRQPRARIGAHLVARSPQHMPQLPVTRRLNLEVLRRKSQPEQIAGGGKAFGLEAASARKLEVSPTALPQPAICSVW